MPHIDTWVFYETLVEEISNEEYVAHERKIFDIVAKYVVKTPSQSDEDAASPPEKMARTLKWNTWERVEKMITGISKENFNSMNAEIIDLLVAYE